MQIPKPLSPSFITSWISSTFPYPNTQKVSTISDLRSGVAIAQILTQIIPPTYCQELLSQIETSKIHQAEVCIKNWKVILNTMRKIQGCQGKLYQFSAEGLYYRDNKVVGVVGVVYELWENGKDGGKEKEKEKQEDGYGMSYKNTILSHIIGQQPVPTTEPPKTQKSTKPTSLSQTKKNSIQTTTTATLKTNTIHHHHHNNLSTGNINLSQLSDIANVSHQQISHYQYRGQSGNLMKQEDHCDEGEDGLQGQEQEQEGQDQREEIISGERLRNVKEWVFKKTQAVVRQESSELLPHQCLGHLVNIMFSNSRLNEVIIKEALFQHGPLYVYRRVLDFLVTNQKAEKVNKKTALDLMADIEREGVVREARYWMLMSDLYEFDKEVKRKSKSTTIQTHRTTKSTEKSPKPQQTPTHLKSQNQNPNIALDPNPVPLEKPYRVLRLPLSQQKICSSQQWLTKDLGMQHTVHKIITQFSFQGNPLLNGSAISGVLMRLKIGKVAPCGGCKGYQGVVRVWEEIGRVCALRGYQSIKPFLYILRTNNNPDPKQLVNVFLHMLHQFKQQHLKKHPKQTPTDDPQKCNQCPSSLHLLQKPIPSPSPQSLLCTWLSSNFSINLSPQSYLSVSKMTQVCRQLISAKLYKETTIKIQQNNVQKILAELRRIGIPEYFQVKREHVMGQDQGIRWRILADFMWVIDGNIEFCRN